MKSPRPGLRELKKQQTRESIASAALRLTREKGLSEVTLEDIADEAFVSPRTFSNYFASKEEAVLAAGARVTEKVLDEFSETPAGEPPLCTMRDLVTSYARQNPEHFRRSAEMTALAQENPSLRPLRIAQEVYLVEELSIRIAERTGTSVAADPYPSLVASAAISAIVTSVAIWAQEGFPAERLPALLEDSFEQVSSGLPRPPAPTITVELDSASQPDRDPHAV